MNATFLVPILVGFCIVFQGLFNSYNISMSDLNTTILWTGIIFFVLSLFMYSVSFFFPEFMPDILKIKNGFSLPLATNLFAGICGYFIVTLMPLSFSSLGPAITLIIVIAAQLFFGLLIDIFYMHNPLNFMKILGASVTFLGAIIFIFFGK